MHRLLVALPQPLPSTLRVEGEPFHHLVHVLRARKGTKLELFDGHGNLCAARVVTVSDSAAELSLAALATTPASRKVSVLQGLPKGERWDFVLQKGTELGTTEFLPIRAERTVVKLDAEAVPERRERWQKIADEAARQSGRADVPQVHPLMSLNDAAEHLAAGTELWILDELEKTRTLRQVVARLSQRDVEKGATSTAEPAPVAIAVGPEGGWTRDEVSLLQQHGGTSISLGPRILRSETATLAALSVLLCASLTLGE